MVDCVKGNGASPPGPLSLREEGEHVKVNVKGLVRALPERLPLSFLCGKDFLPRRRIDLCA